MINMYVAVQRTGEKNELKHWKYLRREKKNGKWRYYYEKDNSMLNVGKTESITRLTISAVLKLLLILLSLEKPTISLNQLVKISMTEQELVISYM